MEPKKTRQLIPTLLIGLGGTGYRTLKLIKKKFLESPHYNYKVPPMVNFLSFDTDTNIEDKKTEDVLTTTEKIVLTVDTASVLGNIGQFPHIKKWFPVHKIQETVAHGARQIRALGRLSIFSNIDVVTDSIREALHRINDKRLLSGADIVRTSDMVPLNVFLVSSVSGGTGSGMVTDLPYILRQVIAKETVQHACEIHGYLFMPDAFVDIADSELERLKANGAAALKEIDLFMENMERFSTRYSDGFAIDEQVGMQKPYDFAYLVSGVDITDQHTIEKVTAEQVFHGFGTDLTKDSKSYLANVPTNAFKAIPGGEFVGKRTNYSSFGVSSCAIPLKKIIEIFSNKFSAGLMSAILEYANPKDGKTDNPWEKDLQLFTRNNGLEIDNKDELKILDKLMEVNKAAKLTASKYKELKVTAIGDILLQDQVAAEKSYKDIKTELNNAKEGVLTGIIKNYLTLITESMNDANRGVRFVTKTSEHLFNMLEQFRGRLEREREIKRKEMARFIQIVREKKAYIEEESQKNWLMRSKEGINTASIEWVNNNNNAFMAQLQIDRRDVAMELIDTLMQTVAANFKKLQTFNSVVELLETKFSKNATFTGSTLEESESDWLLNNSIIATDDLNRLYDGKIGNSGIYETVFIGKEGLNIAEKWFFYAENSVMFESDVMDYSKKILEEKLKELSIEEFLLEKSKVTGEDEIRKAGEALAQKGRPLWQLNRGLYTGHLVPLNLLGVFDKEATQIHEHVQSILKKDSQVVSTKDPHRISLVQSEHGAPLFALSKIEDWENKYNKFKKTEFLHAITEEEYKIEWDNYPFRPISIDKKEGIKFFTLGNALKFIQAVKVDGKTQYYCTFENDETVNPDDKKDTWLGTNRIDAFENFIKNQQVRKLKHLIERALDKKGSYKQQIEFITLVAQNLRSYLEKIDESTGIYELIREEVKALAELLKELDKKRVQEESEEQLHV